MEIENLLFHLYMLIIYRLLITQLLYLQLSKLHD